MPGQKRRTEKIGAAPVHSGAQGHDWSPHLVAPDFPIPDVLCEVIAKRGPVEGFLLQAPLIRAQHSGSQWVVDAMAKRTINARRDDSVLCCK